MPRKVTILTLHLLGALLLVGASVPAWAHSPPPRPATADGIVIPTLTHGQMAVIAEHRTAILDLAAQQIPTDAVMRRLEGYVSFQFFACLWGVVPGSLSQESSPFNECSHAYLAGTKALLLHLQTMPGNHAAVTALVRSIELEMLAHGASLVLCRYSDEAFNTSEVIGPRWSNMPFDPPCLLISAGVLVPAAGLGLVATRRGSKARSRLGELASGTGVSVYHAADDVPRC